MNLRMRDEFPSPSHASSAIAGTTWHALLWLVIANAIGVMIAVLLLLPGLNNLLGEWTYGRWIMVHMNLELYGWTAIPLVGFLFNTYGADRSPASSWCRSILWIWSAALGIGALSWLSGGSSGKLFLDWTGYARVLFTAALIVLWLFLSYSFAIHWSTQSNSNIIVRTTKAIGLLVLFTVPFALYVATDPNLYPAVNPDTGGPTGASQLESSLAIVAILLLLPFGIANRKNNRSKSIVIGWATLAAESLLCLLLGRADSSHHSVAQYMSLGSLLIWLPLTPAYYTAFEWNKNTRRWRLSFLCWWAVLIPTGWIFFLPGVLDHFKFTDGLVGHSFVAMAGFTSSLIIFVMVQLLGDDGWIFNRSRSFYMWHGSVAAYIVLVTVAGWYEGFDPTFTIVPGIARNVLYVLRLGTGILMTLSSLDWFVDATTVLRQQAAASTKAPQEQTV
jgi:cytochrome c oxidase cbb3-type subunit 1